MNNTESMETLAAMFKALGDPTRLRIMHLLTQGELCVCDIMAALETPQSTISRHLAYLKNASLIKGKRCGKWMHYELLNSQSVLARDMMAALARSLGDIAQAAADMERLRHYLATKSEYDCGKNEYSGEQHD